MRLSGRQSFSKYLGSTHINLPFSVAYFIVGRAAIIRYKYDKNRGRSGLIWCELTAGFVIFPSCMGTLKSTRMRTRLPLRSRSVIASLLESDMVKE